MKPQEFLHKAARASAYAKHLSVKEMLRQWPSEPTARRFARVAFAKTLAPLIPERLPAELGDFTLLTSGGEQLVYTDGNEVLKLLFNSITTRREAALQAASHHQFRFDTARSFLGNHLVDTVYSALAIYGGYVVAARQNYISAEKTFHNVEEMVRYESSEEHLDKLRRFALAIQALHAKTGLYPDINGLNNLMIAKDEDRSLIAVDTIIVTPEMQDYVERQSGLTIGEQIERRLSLMLGWQPLSGDSSGVVGQLTAEDVFSQDGVSLA